MKNFALYILPFIIFYALLPRANANTDTLPIKNITAQLHALLKQNEDYIASRGPDFFTQKIISLPSIKNRTDFQAKIIVPALPDNQFADTLALNAATIWLACQQATRLK